MSNPFDPEVEIRNFWLRRAAAFVAAEIDSRPTAHAAGQRDALDVLGRTISEQPVDIDKILSHLAEAATVGLQTNGPGYLAYIPGGGLFSAALASFVSLVLNRFVGLAPASPRLARLEHDVIDFLANECGYAKGSAGILTSGGSIANLSAVVTARVDKLGESGDYRSAIIYTSSQAHRSVVKAARLSGIPADNVRLVPVDQRLRLDVMALSTAIAADRAKGLRPFLVVASAGTTNTGAIDPLPDIATLCAREALWMHVDAAYGGAFVLTDEGKAKLAGIGRADSITLDPHKGFFLPYGVGCLLVRDGVKLMQAHADRGAYLQDLGVEADIRSATDYGPELSRNDRGVLVWLPFMLHGVAAFREALADKLVQARRVHAALVADERVEVVGEPELSIVAFRLRRQGTLDEWNRANLDWLARINACDRVHLSSTRLPVDGGDVTTLRVCVLAFRTDAARIDMAIEDILGTVSASASGQG